MKINQLQIIIASILLAKIPVIFGKSMIEDGKCIGSGEYCYCDESCYFFGDCCYKSSQVSMNKSLLSCPDGYFVINKCPSDVLNKNLKGNCEEERKMKSKKLIFHGPVYGIYGNTRYVFKNEFCAICNGRSQYQFAKVTREMNIENSKQIQFEIPGIFQRVCHKQIIDECPESGSEIFKRLCNEEPTFYIKDSDSEVYRNAYCYFCNKISMITNVGTIKLRPFSRMDYNHWCPFDCKKKLDSLSLPSTNTSMTVTDIKMLMVALEMIFVVICSIISISSLLILLFVYIFVENQGNIATKITICLSSSILLLTLTNISMYFMENLSSFFCFYFSILYHYCFLNTFFWMSIFALDVYRSVTSSHVTNQRHFPTVSSTKLKIYSLVGYVGPFVITIAALTIQLVNKNNILSAGFGERQCFINRLIGGLIWFFIPLCICLLVNTIVCICMYRFIYVANRRTAIIMNTLKARKKSFIVCMKLSILFGAVWLPAFVGIFLDNHVLTFIGGVLSSLQGTAVSICLIFGVKIRKKTYQYFRSLSESNDRLTKM